MVGQVGFSLAGRGEFGGGEITAVIKKGEDNKHPLPGTQGRLTEKSRFLGPRYQRGWSGLQAAATLPHTE